MASNKIHFKNPHTGENRKAPVGFSWTVLFFGFIPPLFRSDWKGAGLIFLLSFGVTLISLDAPAPIAVWVGVIFAFFYNKFYIKELVKKGYQAYGIEHGVLAEELFVHKLNGLVPAVLEEPQTNQKSQEPEPKKENSIKDKLRQLNDLKENNLINDEEYNKKKEKLLEEL